MVGIRDIEPSEFDGVPLSQLRNWAAGGSPASMHNQSEKWQREDKFLRDLAEEIKTKLVEAGAVLRSRSGAAVQSSMAPVVLWTEATAGSAQAHSLRMIEQGEAFTKLQSSMPGAGEEQEEPQTSWLDGDDWSGMSTGASDAEPAKAHNEQLRQQAVAAYESYDETSRQRIADSPLFTPPPGSEDPDERPKPDDSPAKTSSASAGGAVVSGPGAPGLGAGPGVVPGGPGLPPGGSAVPGTSATGPPSSAAGAASRSPGGMMGAAAGRPAGSSDDDAEHETPEYLRGDHGFFDGDLPKTAPPVFE